MSKHKLIFSDTLQEENTVDAIFIEIVKMETKIIRVHLATPTEH